MKNLFTLFVRYVQDLRILVLVKKLQRRIVRVKKTLQLYDSTLALGNSRLTYNILWTNE